MDVSGLCYNIHLYNIIDMKWSSFNVSHESDHKINKMFTICKY